MTDQERVDQLKVVGWHRSSRTNPHTGEHRLSWHPPWRLKPEFTGKYTYYTLESAWKRHTRDASEKKCDECGGPGLYEHECPYQADINNNPDIKCNCCDACMHKCAMN